jgi:hypothetical protein
MRERVERLGGRLVLDGSRPGGGARLTVELPLAPGASRPTADEQSGSGLEEPAEPPAEAIP